MIKTKDLLDLLKSKKILDDDFVVSLIPVLPPDLSFQTLPIMVKKIVDDQIMEQKEVINFFKEMAKQSQVRQALFPYLDSQIFCHKVCQIIGADVMNPEDMRVVKENLSKKVPIEELLSSIFLQIAQEQIPKGDLKKYMSQLKGDMKFYERYVNYNPPPKEEHIEMYDGENPKDIEQYIKQLQQDIDQIPEKMDQYKLKSIEIQISKQLLQAKKQPSQIAPEIKQYLQKLELKHEEATRARKMIFQGKDIRRNLKIIRHYLCGIDIQDVFRMIRIGRSMDIKGKENNKIILFMGLSKAGKTTIITRLVGYDMHLTKINGIYTMQPKKKVSSEHQSLKIGFSNRSTTRYPSIFKTRQDFLDDDEEIQLMDSPGFQDTVSVEVQISNRITTIEALREVSFLKIVIVINQKNWGVSGADIQKLAKTVSSITRDYKSIKQSISFLFNQFDEKFAESFQSNVKDLIKNIKSKKGAVINKSFDDFFSHLQKEAKNPLNLVYPQKLNQKKFFQMIMKKDWIENAKTNLVCDIGVRAKDEIKNLSKRYVNQFYRNYQKKQLKEAQYCISMLKKIISEPNLQSDSEYEIQQILLTLDKNLTEKFNKINNEFQELIVRIINDKDKRKQNYKRINEQYKQLEKQIEKYKIIDQKYTKNIKTIIEEVQSLYMTKMNQWKSNDSSLYELQLITETGVEFFQFFSPQKYSDFKQKIQNQIQQYKNSIFQEMKTLSSTNKLLENFSRYQSLSKIIGHSDQNIFKTHIQNQLNNRINTINFIDFSNYQQAQPWNKWIKKDCIYENQFTKLRDLVGFLDVVSKYPKQITGVEEMNKIIKLHGYIVDTLPKNIMNQFDNQLKTEDIQEEFDEQSKKSEKFERLQKINKVKTLIRWMKGLNSIEYIRNFHDNRLEKAYDGLISMIDNSMKKFNKIEEELAQNNINKVKTIMCKAKSEFKQLKSLIQLVDMQKLTEDFQKLVDKLSYSYLEYIMVNSFDECQVLSFTKTKEFTTCISFYKNLKQFRSLLFIQNQKIFFEINEKLTSYEEKMIEPINNYIQQMREFQKQGKTFRVGRQETYLIYCDKVRDFISNLLSQRFRTLFNEKIRQNKKIVDEIIKNIIIDPCSFFLDLLSKNGEINFQWVESIENYLKVSDNMSKLRKAYSFLNQLLSCSKVLQNINGYEKLMQIQEVSHNQQDQILRDLKQKLQMNYFAINNLDQLRRVVQKLKSLQGKNQKNQLQYQQLLRAICGNQKQLNKNSQSKKNQLIKQYKENKIFQQEQFIVIYQIFCQDKTQNGINSKNQLKQLFEKYKKNTQKQLNDLKTFKDDEPSKYLSDSLKILNRFCSFAKNLKEKLKNQFKTQIELNNLSNTVQTISSVLVSYLTNFIDSSSLSTKKLQEVKKQLIKIEKQISDLKLLGINFTDVDKKKKQMQITSFSDYINKQKRQKEQKIKNFLISKELHSIIDENFIIFFNSLQQSKEQQQVKKSIYDYFIRQLNNLKNLYDSDYDSFILKNENLDADLRNMPVSISRQFLEKKFNQIKQNQKKANEDIAMSFEKKEDNQQQEILNILMICENAEKSNNTIKIQRIKKLFLQKFKFVKKQDKLRNLEKILKQIIWKFKQKFQSIKFLRDQLTSIQKNCLERLNIISERYWSRIYKQYHQNSGKLHDSQSDDGSKIRMSGFSAIINTKSNIQYVLNCYQILYNQESFFEKNLQLAREVKALMEKQFKKIAQFFYQWKLNLKSITQQRITNQLGIKKVLGIYHIISRDIKCMQNQSFSIIRPIVSPCKFSLDTFQDQVQKEKQKLFQKVKKLLQNRFQYFNDIVKNHSSQDQQQRVTIFEEKLKYLENLMNAGYNQLSPPIQIRLEEIKSQLIQDANQITQDVLQMIKKIIDPQDIENDKINEEINSVPKLFKVIDSKFRAYMPKGDNFKKIKDKLDKVSLDHKKDFEKALSDLLAMDEKSKDQFKQFKIKQGEKFSEQKEKINNQKDKLIKDKNDQYKKIMQNLGPQDKNKKEKQLSSELIQINNQIQRKIEDFKVKYMDKKVKKFTQEKIKEQQELIQIFITKLIILKKLSFVYLISSEADKQIQVQLKKLAKSKLLDKIFKHLNESNLTICGILLDNPAFYKMKGQIFTSLTSQSNNIDFILEKLKKHEKINKQMIQIYKAFFQTFIKQQDKYIETYKQSREKSIINTLKVNIREDGRKLSQKLKDMQIITGQQKVSILAKIFALWSISISEEENDDQNELLICYKAHAAQIIGILIIICVQNNENNNGKAISQNRLAQVKTGEGKSILLAGLSIYFALLGYEVQCCCYSEILSKRDQKDFSNLFKMCGVEKKINYGIFENVIRNLLNKKSQNELIKLQDTIKQALLAKQESWFGSFLNMIKNKLPKFNISHKQNLKILIIDEIDVLFDKSYFGDTFNQTIDIRDEKITSLFHFIWKNKKDINYQKIRRSKEFQQIIQKYKPLKQILKNQIYGMIAALDTFQHQQYVIIDKRIMYKVEDTYQQINYRYNTVYAYLNEHSKGFVSDAALNQHMSINLCVSQFAYARLPEFYTHVVGVTGTLVCLPSYIKKYLQQKYNISSQNMYSIPSVYSKQSQDQAQNRIMFEPIITTYEDHHAQIIKNFEPQLVKERPILIFFRSKSQLIEFHSSPLFVKYLKNTSYITQQHSTQQRQERIKNSSRKQNITLMTTSFTRGIDFRLLNKRAKDVGGFHGIVTYLIQSTADLIQASGRVARQGNPGSFIEIFTSGQLALLNIQENDPNPINKIKNRRLQKQQQDKDTCYQRLQVSNQRHDETMAVFNDENISQKKLINYVQSKNKFPKIDKTSTKARMLFLVDATISMATLFNQLKLILPDIFSDVYQTLEKNNKIKGELQMQVLLYRNYNAKVSQLIETSPFDNTGKSLKEFICNSRVSGGWGNEAVEVGLQYAQRVDDIGEIVIIGDARGNSPLQVKLKRQRYPHLEEQRIKKGLTMTTTEQQLDKLVNKKVKISSFYLSKLPSVSEYFQRLANSTGGKATYVDINDTKSVNIITQLVVESGLRLIGGQQNSNALLHQYREILSRKMAKNK